MGWSAASTSAAGGGATAYIGAAGYPEGDDALVFALGFIARGLRIQRRPVQRLPAADGERLTLYAGDVLIDAIDVKRRTRFELDNVPYSCLEVEVNSPTARGGQTLVRIKMRNLLTNALRKRQNADWVAIEARLALLPAVQFAVIDSGSAAPEHIARTLFQSPVGSDAGLGVGLYQAARQATRAGYRLSLADNQNGRVEMRLDAATGSRPEGIPVPAEPA